jgi:hypothetical protein
VAHFLAQRNAWLHGGPNSAPQRDAWLHNRAAGLQAEARYHSQAPLEVLYSALSRATSDSHASVELLTSMKAATEEQMQRQQDLRARHVQLLQQDDRHKSQAVAMLAGLQALLAAKLDLMQGHCGTEFVASDQQYSTATADVLALS